jgi:hypothetical protein
LGTTRVEKPLSTFQLHGNKTFSKVKSQVLEFSIDLNFSIPSWNLAIAKKVAAAFLD